jgi:hypothetical protein
MPRDTPSYHTLQALFHLPREQAAASVGVSVSAFRRLARAHGIARWPFCAEHGNSRNASVVHFKNMAMQSAQRGWTRESLLEFAHLPARKVCKRLGLKAASFRAFHKSLGIMVWPYRPQKNTGKPKRPVDGAAVAMADSSDDSDNSVAVATKDVHGTAGVGASGGAVTSVQNGFVDSSDDFDDSAVVAMKCVDGTVGAADSAQRGFDDSSKESDDSAVGDAKAGYNPLREFIDSSESSSDNEHASDGEGALSSPVVKNLDAVCTGSDTGACEDGVPHEGSYWETILRHYELHGCLPDVLAQL